MPTAYWEGTRQAQLTRSQVTASWGRPGVAHSGTSIGFANRAFEIYHSAHQSISRCSDYGHQRQMMSSLHDAARTGWGLGVDDLEEAFQHLDSNGGRWTDNATKSYFGGRNKVFHSTLVTAPVSTVNFMNAIDSRVAELRTIMNRYHQQARTLSRAADGHQWAQVGTGLGEIKSWGERAKPFLWMVPTVQDRLGQAVSFTGVLSNIHSGLNTYGLSIRAGFDSDTATAIAALRTAMGWVPVLGDFYGRAVDLIPGLRVWFQGLIRDYCRRIDRAASGR